MVTVSPPVSPSVVAAILMIQNPRVTAGTLLIVEWAVTRRTSRSVVLRANVQQRNQRRRATERAFPAHSRGHDRLIDSIKGMEFIGYDDEGWGEDGAKES